MTDQIGSTPIEQMAQEVVGGTFNDEQVLKAMPSVNLYDMCRQIVAGIPEDYMEGQYTALFEFMEHLPLPHQIFMVRLILRDCSQLVMNTKGYTRWAHDNRESLMAISNPEQKLTEESGDQYLQNNGVYCPHCLGDLLTQGTVRATGEFLYRKVACQDCLNEWEDRYTHSGISDGESEYGYDLDCGSETEPEIEPDADESSALAA